MGTVWLVQIFRRWKKVIYHFIFKIVTFFIFIIKAFFPFPDKWKTVKKEIRSLSMKDYGLARLSWWFLISVIFQHQIIKSLPYLFMYKYLGKTKVVGQLCCPYILSYIALHIYFFSYERNEKKNRHFAFILLFSFIFNLWTKLNNLTHDTICLES